MTRRCFLCDADPDPWPWGFIVLTGIFTFLIHVAKS